MAVVYLKEIPVIVDDDVYEDIMQYNWSLRQSDLKHGLFYFTRSTKTDGIKHSLGLHRHIMGSVYKDGLVVDHINGNTLDCRRSNMRITTQGNNARNMRMKHYNQTGYKGVHYSNVKHIYVAQIHGHGKMRWIFASQDPIECARYYDMAALYYHGEYARINFNRSDYKQEDIDKLIEQMESPKMRTNKSGYIGVSYSTKYKRWIPAISFNGKDYKLTGCPTPEEAALARDKKAYQLLGAQAKLNFPDRIAEYNLDSPQ